MALVGPLFVDWTSYRAAFEREASLALGQPVRVLGEADMQILPLPHLQFHSVHVGPDDQAPILVVDKFDVRIELFPLVKGQIEVVDMTLESPRLSMRLDEEGRFVWRRDAGNALELDAGKIRLNAVHIKNGRIDFEDKSSGRKGQVEKINGNLTARSLLGPYKTETTFVFKDQLYSLMLSSGLAAEAGVRVKSLLTPTELPVTLAMDGQISRGKDGRYHYVAKSDLHPVGGNGAGDVAPWQLSGKSDLTLSALVMPSFEFQHGAADNAYRLNGSGKIAFGVDPRFDLSLSSRQIDFDRSLGNGPNAPVDLKAGMEALATSLNKLPHPTMPGHVAFDVAGVILGGGILRDVTLDATFDRSVWQLAGLELDLPGQSHLAMKGRFAGLQADQMQEHVALSFDGDVSLRSDQPTALAKWWLRDQPSSGRLEPFAFVSRISMTPDRISLDELDLDLDGHRLTGRVDWLKSKAEGGKAKAVGEASGSLDMRIEAELLDLDALKGFGSLLLSTSVGKGVGNAAPLREIGLDISSDQLRAGSFQGRSLSARMRLAQGMIDIDELLIEDFAGARLSTKGTLRDLQGQPGGALEGALKAQDLAGLSSLVSNLFPDQPAAVWLSRVYDSFSPVDLSFTASAQDADKGLKLSLNGLLGGGAIHVSGSLRGLLQDWQTQPMTAQASLYNPNGRHILGLLGLDAMMLDMPALTASLSLDGTLSDGFKAEVALAGADATLRYEGTLGHDGSGGWQARGEATLAAKDLVPYLMTAGIPLTDPGLALPVDLSSKIALSGTDLSLHELKGAWDTQPLAGALAFKQDKAGRRVTGSLSLGDLDGIWLGETVLGPGRLTVTGPSWPDTAFLPSDEAGEAKDLTLDLAIKARSLELSAPYLFKQPEFSLIWRPDEVVVRDFSGLLAGGKISGGLQLQNVEGEALVKSHIKAEDVALAPFIWQRDGRAVADGRLDLSTTLQMQGRSLAGMMSGLSGDGTFALDQGRVRYVNPEAFAQVVRAVDAGLPLKENDIRSAFLAHMDAGTTDVDQLSGTFRIAGGALRATNIETDAGILQSRGNLMLDLSSQRMEADWSIKVEPDEADAVTGAQPEVGLVFRGALASPERIVDVAPLAGYLSIRAFEREVERVETLQADIMEKERMRRLLKVYGQQARARDAAAGEAAKKRALERQRAEEEARRKAEEEKQRVEEEARRKIEQERRAEEARKAEQERRAEEEARLKAEEARKAEEEARLKAEEARKAEEERLAREATDARQSEPANNRDDVIETRPLVDLTGESGQSSSPENSALSGQADETTPSSIDLLQDRADSQSGDPMEPVQNGPDEIYLTLPEKLGQLPRKPAVPPKPTVPPKSEQINLLPGFEDSPTDLRPGYNDLIEQLRQSPDRIIQLD